MSVLIEGVFNEGFEAGYERALKDLEELAKSYDESQKTAGIQDVAIYRHGAASLRRWIEKHKGTKNE